MAAVKQEAQLLQRYCGLAIIIPFKVIDFGTNRKPACDVLLVTNANLHLISNRFKVIADDWSNFVLSPIICQISCSIAQIIAYDRECLSLNEIVRLETSETSTISHILLRN